MGGEFFRQLQNSNLGYVIGAFMAFVVFFSSEFNRVNTTKHLISFFRRIIQAVRKTSKKSSRGCEYMKKQLQMKKTKV